MAVNYNDLAITSLETIIACNVVTGDYMWTMDELQNATISNTQEKEDIVGKQGRKLNSLKRNKGVTVSGSNGLISGGMIATQVGSEFESKVANVMVPDHLTVSTESTTDALIATTTYKAVGTAGNEIGVIWVKNADGTLGAKLTQDSAASAGKFAYDPATKKITFDDEDVSAGDEVAVYYNRAIEANVLENMSDHYSEKAALYIDAIAEDKCGVVYRVQFHIPKADFDGNFDLEMGDSQTVLSFNAESLAGACTAGGALWTMIVFGEDTPDYTDTPAGT